MSKKHFVALAAMLRESKPPHREPEAMVFWIILVGKIEDLCATFAPKFDRARFLRACGIAEGK